MSAPPHPHRDPVATTSHLHGRARFNSLSYPLLAYWVALLLSEIVCAEAFSPSPCRPTVRTHVRADSVAPSRRDILGRWTAVATGVLAPPPAAADAAASPAPYRVRLLVQLDPATTGTLEMEVRPAWAPAAARRFRTLVERGFYDGSRFHRVLPGYVAQFGISADPALNKEWLLCGKGCRALEDEPRTEKNKKGTVSFASGGKNGRQTQVFVNLGNNGGPPNFLDAQGFVPFARVVQGMDDVVGKLNKEYGIVESVSGGMAGSIDQTKAAYYGKDYLDTLYPKLSYIKSARIIETTEE